MTAQPGAAAAPRAGSGARFRVAAFNGLLLVAFISGITLRVWQIDIQVPIDDEWHAIHKLMRAGPLDIFTHVGYADYSIPLTLYYQWLYRTVGLSEWGLHLPPLAASIGLLLTGPRLLASSFALPTRALWTALVAISPLLVYHGRIARPYALTCLLAFVAILGFRAWRQEGRPRDAVVYAAATMLAGWLHAITLPFTLSPFVYYGVRALRPIDRQALVRLVKLGLATALPLALLLAPPIVVDWTEFSGKAGLDHVTVESAYRSALMLAGTGSPIVAFVFYVAAGAGWCRLYRRDGDLAAYLATVIGLGAVSVASSRAGLISHPLVFARYLLPVLPFVLLLAAEGGAGALAGVPRRWSAFIAGVAVVALLIAGPIPMWWHYPNQFIAHLRYQFDYDPDHNPYVQRVRNDPIPAFYADLGARPPGSVTLVETPWRLESHFNALSLYQDTHRQRILIGLATPACGTFDFGEYPETSSGMRMREFVHLASIIRGDPVAAEYLIVHLQPANVAAEPPAWPDMAACLPAIEAALGAPVWRDERMRVFALPKLSPLGNGRRTVQQ
jgi:hypothetical protein